jgi:Arc/MetJ-type ribon-helix-helix transcriptional regulator
MTTISVPLQKKHEERLDELVKFGVGSSRADVMRKALSYLSEEEAVAQILRAEQEMKEGKLLKGNLKKLAKLIK